MQFIPLGCCGIKEIADISTADCTDAKAIERQMAFAILLRNPGCAYLIFSGTQGSGYHHQFKQYLLKQGLGEILDLPTLRNPNSGHVIEPFMLLIRDQVLWNRFKIRLLRENEAACREYLHRNFILPSLYGDTLDHLAEIEAQEVARA